MTKTELSEKYVRNGNFWKIVGLQAMARRSYIKAAGIREELVDSEKSLHALTELNKVYHLLEEIVQNDFLKEERYKDLAELIDQEIEKAIGEEKNEVRIWKKLAYTYNKLGDYYKEECQVKRAKQCYLFAIKGYKELEEDGDITATHMQLMRSSYRRLWELERMERKADANKIEFYHRQYVELKEKVENASRGTDGYNAILYRVIDMIKDSQGENEKIRRKKFKWKRRFRDTKLCDALRMLCFKLSGYYTVALRSAVREGKISPDLLQQKLDINILIALKVMDELVKIGIVDSGYTTKPRCVRWSDEDLERYLKRNRWLVLAERWNMSRDA